MKPLLKLLTVLTMSHNKTIPQVKGDFLLGNLCQIMANPFQALCDWQRNYSDLVSFRLATRQFYLFSHPKLMPQIVTAGNNMLNRWQQLGEGAQVNLSYELMRLTLEVITQTMFSTSVLDKQANRSTRFILMHHHL